jgi:hypothetical protein
MDFLRKLFGANRSKKYAVEVEKDFAESFKLADAQVKESWQNDDGSVVFILESSHDIREAAEKTLGVRAVSTV